MADSNEPIPKGTMCSYCKLRPARVRIEGDNPACYGCEEEYQEDQERQERARKRRLRDG